MKLRNIIKNGLALSVLLLGMNGCDMETPMHYYVDPDAPKTIQDVQNELNGAYHEFGGYRFYGRNVVALGDIATGVSTVEPNKGHFVTISQWTFSEDEGILEDIWKSGYVIIGTTTDVINDSKELLSNNALSEKDKSQVNNMMMQAYGLKAYTYYILVNIFGKDVVNNGNTLGLILVKDKKPAPKEALTRATVSETYEYILELLASAKKAMSDAKDVANSSALYVSATGLNAMEAKVYLSMHRYSEAKTAATEALKSYKGISNEDYLAMWKNNVPSSEDILTLKKTEDDNLSANALNTLYGSYLASITPQVTNLVKPTDIRYKLIKTKKEANEAIQIPHPMKYDGIPNAAAVSNIPVLRYSDMILTLAEADANLGMLPEATKNLFKVASRDASIVEGTFTFATKEELLKAIAEERIREFFAEGHRLNDLKRTGVAATVNNDPNYVISKFAYPIPASEINAGDMTQQNSDWRTLIPTNPKPKE